VAQHRQFAERGVRMSGRHAKGQVHAHSLIVERQFCALDG
jgi:hypothetical protein